MDTHSPPPSDEAAQSASARCLPTTEQVADRWQVSRAHVYGIARAGKLPTVAIGR